MSVESSLKWQKINQSLHNKNNKRKISTKRKKIRKDVLKFQWESINKRENESVMSDPTNECFSFLLRITSWYWDILLKTAERVYCVHW